MVKYQGTRGNEQTCRKCGIKIFWFDDTFGDTKPYNSDLTRHWCETKVKVYTEEEKRELEKKLLGAK